MSEAGEAGASAPPQLSPDGFWWWTGSEWVPADQAPTADAEPDLGPEPEAEPEPEPVPAAWNPPGATPAPTGGESASTQAPAQQSWPAPAQQSWPAPSQPGWPTPAQPGWAPAAGATWGSGYPSSGSSTSSKVVIVIVAVVAGFILVGILAAIAIPTFLNQRYKGWDAETKSALKLAAVAEQSYYTDNSRFTDSMTLLTSEGFRGNPDVTVVVVVSPDGSAYCLQGIHRLITADRSNYAAHVWYLGSRTGTPSNDVRQGCG